MTDLYRVRSVWSGFPGGPGVTTMFFLDIATAIPDLRAFWDGLKAHIPTDVHIQVENAGDVINDTNGDLVSAWSTGSVAEVVGTGAGTYAAPAGGVIDWQTATIAGTRRLRGRTFIVPLSGDSWQTDGSLSSACITVMLAAASTFQAAQDASFVIWHRGSGSDGSNGLVTAVKVPDMVAVLRSRRD